MVLLISSTRSSAINRPDLAGIPMYPKRFTDVFIIEDHLQKRQSGRFAADEHP